MWISKAKLDAAQESLNRAVQMQLKTFVDLGGALGEVKRLEVENARLRVDLDWFKLRLNAVEKERAQLIAAAIGVKISIPEFQVTDPDDHGRALHEMPDLSTIGEDAKDEDSAAPEVGRELATDFSMMPGYRKQR